MTQTGLEKLQLFEGCTTAFFEKLDKQKQRSSYKKGRLLFVQEDPAERFYFVHSGWVKLFRETLDGTQAVIDILSEGHIFGDTALFHGGKCPFSAEIVEDADVTSFPLSAFKEELESNIQFSLNMVESLSRARCQKVAEVERLTIQNAPQRIGCFLLCLADQSEKGPIKIHLPYDKTLVAARLGMQPETFSRALAKLRDQAGLHLHGATIEINSLQALADYCCAACSSNFPCKDLQCKTLHAAE